MAHPRRAFDSALHGDGHMPVWMMILGFALAALAVLYVAIQFAIYLAAAIINVFFADLRKADTTEQQ